jgi:hypothetical protein
MAFDLSTKISRALAKEWLDMPDYNAKKQFRNQYIKLSLKFYPHENVDPTKFQQVKKPFFLHVSEVCPLKA